MTARDEIVEYIEKKKNVYTEASDKIWEYAELALEETRSAAVLIEILKNEGFLVTENVADLPTAFVAEFGCGKPVIAYLGEYDALPGLSQKADVFEQEPVLKDAPGHGCGHNLLGVAALAAAVAAKQYMEAHGTKGTVRFYGCPAEEGGCGKGFMARDGLFKDVDAAFTWHPSTIYSPWIMSSLSVMSMDFRFTGKTSHAGSAPHLGRSALDACELMNVGVNYLREHVPEELRIHYAYLDAGGTAANIVQGHSMLRYMVRAKKMQTVMDVAERIKDVAKGAALMTGTQVECKEKTRFSDFVPNPTLTNLLYESMCEVGAPSFTDEEYKYAEKIRSLLNPATFRTLDHRETGMSREEATDYFEKHALFEKIGPFKESEEYMSASTDVGDVSQATPTAQMRAPCYAIGTPGHSWYIVAQGKSSIAHKAILITGKCLALAGVKVLEDTSGNIIRRARQELLKKTGGIYHCPFPEGLKPQDVL